ncbi:Uncharacterised protein [uncultured archaeon]|nr:Uncharacterised protein [uncultured archaeon]
MAKKLNLGCGEFRKEGYVNVDYYSVSKPDVKHDLNKFPYPFSDNEFGLIEADHVLEHLENPFMVIKEMHRISQDGGLIIIKVPHFSRGFTHPEHKRGFDVSLPYYFNPSFKGGYQGFELKIKKMKLSWFAQKYLKKPSCQSRHTMQDISWAQYLIFLHSCRLSCARGCGVFVWGI